MLRVLAYVDYYLPGYKGGGPAVSVSRMVKRLSGDAQFFVFTRDRDLGDDRPYPEIESDDWNELYSSEIFYSSKVSLSRILSAIRYAKPHVIYLNSYFSGMTRRVLLLRALGLIGKPKILIAPRGEFSPGALGLKSRKKSLYLRLANLSRLHKGVTWQVSSVHELDHVQAVVHGSPSTFLKPPDMIDEVVEPEVKPLKQAGHARFAFISRISRKKNLDGALRLLSQAQGDIDLTIYGPIEDQAYWAECQALIDNMPEHIKVDYAGSIPQTKVRQILEAEHFLLFPTHGENFGHVIPEALAAGCPALLSDQTPWLDLEPNGAGWAIALQDDEAWTHAIQRCIDMDDAEYALASHAALDYISAKADIEGDRELGKRMLFAVVEGCDFQKAA